MSDIESFSALMQLTRTATINLTDNQWPDEKLDKKWNGFIDFLNSFNNEENKIAEITDKKLVLLQRLVDQFFNSEKKDISIIRNGSKKNIPQIIYSINKIIVNGLPFSDKENLGSFIFFLKKIPKEDYEKIAIPLMKFYLNSINPEEKLKPAIHQVYSKLDPSLVIFEKDINLYLEPSYLFEKLYQSHKETLLEEALKRVGISERYLSTVYMKSLFFKWFFKLHRYDSEIIQKNKDYIDNCTSDEKKLLFAAIIVSKYSGNDVQNKDDVIKENKDDFIREIDRTIFPTPTIDKTEDEYWNIVNSDLETASNKKLLNFAHQYYVNIFTRFIITKFFDSLAGATNDYNGQVRANYWRRFGTSDAFVDIKLVLNSSQKTSVLSHLAQSEKQIFSKHIIQNYSYASSESALFVMVFKTKTVAVFLETGNAAQVFDSDSPTIKRLLNSSYVSTVRKFKVFGVDDGTIYNRFDGQGRVIQNGDWQYYFTHFLRKNGIVQGKE